jgi:RND family efflux transporter MFP subunit
MRLLSSLIVAATVSGLVGCTKKDESKASLPQQAPPIEVKPASEPDPQPESTTSAQENAAEGSGAIVTDVEEGADNQPAPEPDKPSSMFRLTGEVSSPRRSNIAFRVPGFIEEIAAKPGARLKAGDVMATLDDRDYVLGVNLAKARWEQAVVAFETAKKDFQREQQLQKDNASTAVSFDRIKAAFDNAKIAVEVASLDLEKARRSLADSKLKAPYDCVIAKQLKDQSENVNPGDPVFLIYDTSAVEISLQAPERLIRQIKVGSPIKVTVPSTGFTGSAEVSRIVPVIDEKTRTFSVIAKLSENNDSLIPGSYAEATIE